MLQELADCRQYCAEGLSEAEACGDVEKQAEFLIHGACLNIMEGKNLEHTITLLQVGLKTSNSLKMLNIFNDFSILYISTTKSFERMYIRHQRVSWLVCFKKKCGADLTSTVFMLLF